jgi:hypothetical protein
MITPYTREKLMSAVLSLATSPAPLRQRLENAAIEAVSILTEDDFSPEYRDRWSETAHTLTKEEAVGDEGTIRATISKMTTEELVEAARSIFHLFLDVDRHLEETSRRR